MRLIWSGFFRIALALDLVAAKSPIRWTDAGGQPKAAWAVAFRHALFQCIRYLLWLISTVFDELE
jgi:hypothetical protein